VVHEDVQREVAHGPAVGAGGRQQRAELGEAVGLRVERRQGAVGAQEALRPGDGLRVGLARRNRRLEPAIVPPRRACTQS
jgi:hypothetical protein